MAVGGMLTDETKPALSTLIKINNLGLLTIEGKPGICDEIEQQRGYLKGFIYKDYLANFIEQIIKYEVIVVIPRKKKKYEPIILNKKYLNEPDLFNNYGAISLTKGDGLGMTIKKSFLLSEDSQGGLCEKLLKECAQEIYIVRVPRCKRDLEEIVLNVMLTVVCTPSTKK